MVEQEKKKKKRARKYVGAASNSLFQQGQNKEELGEELEEMQVEIVQSRVGTG